MKFLKVDFFFRKIYDENIHMQIISRIRNEIKFSGSDELSNQLIKDKKKCIEFISRNKKNNDIFKKNKFAIKKAQQIFGYSILYLFLVFVLFLVDKLI